MNKTSTILIVLVALIFGAITTYYIYSNMNTQQTLSAQNGDSVSVHYTGRLENGTKFDSSVDRGQPFTFTLGKGMVIKGWDEGVLGMTVGEKKTLTITADKGYGSQGVPDGQGGYVIPPNATLVFDVEVVSINR